MALHRLLVPLVLLVLLAAAAAKPLEPCPGSCRCFLSEGLKRADCRQVPEWADQQSDAQDVRILPPAAGRGARSHALHLTHFDVFPKVLQLSVTNRGLAELIPSGFHGLHSLQELDVSNNLLERFNYKVFKRMPALRRLILAGNPIILEPGVPFIASKSLLSLDLGHCDVVNVPKGSLDGLRNLTDLSLRGNPLRLQKGRPLLGSPRGLAKLAVLDLSACGLEALPAGVLDMLTGLRRLYLDGNSLHTVERGVLPRGLRHLDLSANLIRDPPTAVITALNLTKLELSDNPVHCTCAFVGLQAWLSGRPVMMERPVICAEPAQYRGVSWTKVDEQQLCSDEAKQANTSESSSSSDESSSADDDYESSSTSSLVVGDDSLPNDDDSLELPPASYEVYTHENNAIDGAPPRPAAILKLPGSQRAVSHNDISFYQADQPADTTPPPAEDDEPAAKGDDDAAAEEEDDAAAKDDDESGAEDEDSDRGSTRDREELETERPPPLGAEVEINKDAETLFSNADTIAMGTHEEAAVKAPEDHEAAESGVVGGEVQDLHAGDSATTVAPDPATETVSEAVPEAAAEAIPETVHESVPESVTETEAVPAATPEAVPEAALEVAAQATAVADPVTEVVTEAPPEAAPAAATTDASTEAAPGTQEGDVAATDAPSPDAEPAQPTQPEGQAGQEATTTPEGVLVSADRADHARALGEPEAGQLPDSAVGEVPQDVDAKGGGSDVVVPPAVEPSSAPTTPAAGGEPELTTLAPVVEEAVVPVVAKNIVGEENDDDAPSKAEAAPAVPEIVEPAIVPDTADEVAAEPKPTPAAIPEAPVEAATETLLPDVAVAADLPEDAKHNEELAVEKVPGTALAGDSGPVELQKSTITYVILGCIVATMIVLVLYALLRSKAKKTDAKQNGVRRENGDARAHLPEGTELKDMMNPLLGTAATADPEAPRRTSLTSLELIREEGEDTETTRLQQAADDHDSPAASQTPKPEKPVRATPEAARRQPAANGKPNGKPANGQPSNGKLSADTAPTTPGQQRAADQPSRVTVKAGVIPTPMPRTPVLVTRNGANGTKVNGMRNT